MVVIAAEETNCCGGTERKINEQKTILAQKAICYYLVERWFSTYYKLKRRNPSIE